MAQVSESFLQVLTCCSEHVAWESSDLENLFKVVPEGSIGRQNVVADGLTFQSRDHLGKESFSFESPKRTSNGFLLPESFIRNNVRVIGWYVESRLNQRDCEFLSRPDVFPHVKKLTFGEFHYFDFMELQILQKLRDFVNSFPNLESLCFVGGTGPPAEFCFPPSVKNLVLFDVTMDSPHFSCDSKLEKIMMQSCRLHMNFNSFPPSFKNLIVFDGEVHDADFSQCLQLENLHTNECDFQTRREPDLPIGFKHYFLTTVSGLRKNRFLRCRKVETINIKQAIFLDEDTSFVVPDSCQHLHLDQIYSIPSITSGKALKSITLTDCLNVASIDLRASPLIQSATFSELNPYFKIFGAENLPACMYFDVDWANTYACYIQAERGDKRWSRNRLF